MKRSIEVCDLVTLYYDVLFFSPEGSQLFMFLLSEGSVTSAQLDYHPLHADYRLLSVEAEVLHTQRVCRQDLVDCELWRIVIVNIQNNR